MTRKQLIQELTKMGFKGISRSSKEQLEKMYEVAISKAEDAIEAEVEVVETETSNDVVPANEVLEAEVEETDKPSTKVKSEFIYSLEGAVEYHHVEELLGIDVKYKPLFECDCENETYDFIGKYSINTPNKRQTFQASEGYNVINTSKVIEAMGLTDKITSVKTFNDDAEVFIWIDIDEVDLGIKTYEDATVGDVVKFGLVIENSYNTNRQFKMHLGTYRLICSNGAVSFRKEFGASVVHRGSIENFVEEMKNLMNKKDEYIQLIKNSTKLVYNKEYVETILHQVEKRLPKKVYNELEERLNSMEKVTAWILSNELTYVASHTVTDPSTYVALQKMADKVLLA